MFELASELTYKLNSHIVGRGRGGGMYVGRGEHCFLGRVLVVKGILGVRAQEKRKRGERERERGKKR